MSLVANPVTVLLEDRNPVHRSRAHTQLGQQALARQELELAREHLEEATDLDPTDETPRRLLAQLRPKRRRFLGLF